MSQPLSPEKAELLRSHKKLIEQEARRYATNLPYSSVLVEAYKHAHKAADSYSPAKGKFSTHLMQYLQKLNRMAASYSSMVRIPENKQFQLNTLRSVETGLHEQLGREPSVSELADATGFGIRNTRDLLQYNRKTVSQGMLKYDPIFSNDNQTDDWTNFVYHDLPARDKVIFEHKVGFGGKSILSNKEIAKLVGVSPTTVANRVNIISKQLEHK